MDMAKERVQLGCNFCAIRGFARIGARLGPTVQNGLNNHLKSHLEEELITQPPAAASHASLCPSGHACYRSPLTLPAFLPSAVHSLPSSFLHLLPGRGAGASVSAQTPSHSLTNPRDMARLLLLAWRRGSLFSRSTHRLLTSSHPLLCTI